MPYHTFKLLNQLPGLVLFNADGIKNTTGHNNPGCFLKRIQRLSPRLGQAKQPGFEETYGGLHNCLGYLQLL